MVMMWEYFVQSPKVKIQDRLMWTGKAKVVDEEVGFVDTLNSRVVLALELYNFRNSIKIF